MLIYNYDTITKEYIGYSSAELDPEETKVQGKDVYLIPANATLKEPPNVKKNQIQVFRNDWYIESDFRGQYMVDDEMQPIEIKEIGDLPLGYALITEEQIELLNEKGTNYFIIQNGKLIVNPNYEEEQAKKERERISHLKCTKRVFVLMLEQLGLDYFERIEPLINANRQARLEWSLCVELERSNPLLDVVGKQLGITPEQLDNLFKYANGEITQEEFRGE